MTALDEIAERVRLDFEIRTKMRDAALSHARTLIRCASHAIRAVHRGEMHPARLELVQAAELASQLNENLAGYQDIYFAGYTQDALKEFVEASIVFAIVAGSPLPTPEELRIPFNTYINGLAEASTEMRRRCLDLIRTGKSQEAVDTLELMEDVYGILITLDFPDAITAGLRRQTDIVRSVVERTRGDLAISLRQQQLEESLRALERKLDGD
jgi:translin